MISALSRTLIATAFAVGIAGAALAQTLAQAPAPGATPPPATTVPLAPKTAVPPPVPGGASVAKEPVAKEKGKAPPKTATTPEGVACSAEADAAALKGKERRAYRRKCIAAIKKGEPKPPATATAPAKAPVTSGKQTQPPAPKAVLPAPTPAPKN